MCSLCGCEYEYEHMNVGKLVHGMCVYVCVCECGCDFKSVSGFCEYESVCICDYD